MIEIMEKISDANENFKENIYLKKFNKKYWINRSKRRRRKKRNIYSYTVFDGVIAPPQNTID